MRRLVWVAVACLLVLLLIVLLPTPRFDDPASTVLKSSEGNLLGARIASDGQWRFPAGTPVPEKFSSSIILFEDRWFRFHPGINPVSVVRALWQNLRSRDVVSGASTITMQVVRLSRKNKPRTVGEKIIEIALALKLELVRSKREILQTYAAHAPFGGNVVGLEAAAWRYFGCSSDQLSWGESAALAVLPNAPSLLFPGRNDIRYKEKRDRLLTKLYARAFLDSLSWSLAISEPVPGEPRPLPRLAPHLLDRCTRDHSGELVMSTLRYSIQEAASRIVTRHSADLQRNYISNLAALMVDVENGEILAYVGNANWDDPNGGAVDMIPARRSTGSILKPFLYAGMLDAGMIMPDMLVPDLPIHFAGYTPKNFDLSYRGAVPAAVALSRSLNIPAVSMLRDYTPARFLDLLKSFGFTSFNQPADHYGLSLILGGGEASLEELVSAYASMARVLNGYNLTGTSGHENIFPVHYELQTPVSNTANTGQVPGPATIWQTFQALVEVNRPEEESGWRYLSSSGLVAWKTGTSFGFRDGWAVGVTPRYVIGVWVGNADGEGRPGLTGVSAAAPVLFDLLGLVDHNQWFEQPLAEMSPAGICRESGYRASVDCQNVDTVMIPYECLITLPCPYHRIIQLDSLERYRVNASCYPVSGMEIRSWFILPPAMEYYLNIKPRQ